MAENKPYSALGFLGDDIRKHKVIVILDEDVGEQTCYLLLMPTQSRLLDDFINAYGDSLRPLAEKIIGTEISTNAYGTLFDEELKIIFAFNTRLAGYSRKRHRIVYKDPQAFLSELLEERSKQVKDPDLVGHKAEPGQPPVPGINGDGIITVPGVVDPDSIGIFDPDFGSEEDFNPESSVDLDEIFDLPDFSSSPARPPVVPSPTPNFTPHLPRLPRRPRSNWDDNDPRQIMIRYALPDPNPGNGD